MSRWRSLFARVALAVLTAATLAAPAAAQYTTWPQQIDAPEGTVVVYQPQYETFKGNEVTGRAAVALTAKGKTEPVFGAFWFTAKIETDQSTDTATFRDAHVTKVRWPDSTPELEERFKAVVDGAVPSAGFTTSLSRFSASLEDAERERKSMADLKNEPPVMVFSEELAVLLLYDGEPRFKAIENSPYERALNTPYAVVRDAKSKTCYLTSGKLWYSAPDPKGPWKPTTSPPADLVQNMPKPESDEPAPKVPPKVIVATEPTEVVASDGKPNWQPLQGGKLLYVTNTETPWVRNLEDQRMYVLVSGRWFRSASTSGPWEFVRADQLPQAFKEIAPASDLGGVRSSVAGTGEATDAMLDMEIPQTSAIKRDEARFEPQYDGSPKFEQIPGTSVKYASNTGQQIIEVGGKYYAADNGVWFVASSPGGPWTVADQVPEEQIQQIPPSSPVYNVTHLHVYQSTPQVVYVGYTPGYMWSFPYYGVPVYGTGFHYPPYYGSYYYPRPATFGFHVGYNPWSGWNFGMSWSSGFFSFGVGWSSGWGGWGPAYRPWGCCGGWYGGGYRRPVYVNTGNINIGNRVNIGNSNWHGARNVRYDNNRLRRDNLYNRPENRVRNADRATAVSNLKARPATGRANDVFADRDGNVARKTKDGWQNRGANGWEKPEAADVRQKIDSKDLKKPTLPSGEKPEAANIRQKVDSKDLRKPAARPEPANMRQRAASADVNRQSLDRAAASRQRGTSREMKSPTRSRPTTASRPSSGSRPQPKRR
jgi:hypothetical protein